MSDNRGSSGAWTWRAVIVGPLLTFCVGGLTYRVCKRDDTTLTRRRPGSHSPHHLTACCVCEMDIVASAK